MHQRKAKFPSSLANRSWDENVLEKNQNVDQEKGLDFIIRPTWQGGNIPKIDSGHKHK